MGRIPEETIQRVIEANDIVDVISGYVPDLKRAGTSFKACCPFHSERTPSFNVTPSRQFFKCFGCGESGNVLGFVMKLENLTFPDAVKKLAQRANIPIIEEEESASQIAERKSRSRLIELHNDFAKFMHERLLKDPRAQHARDYLNSRGFGAPMAKNWKVGWHPEAPAQVIEWAKSKGYKAKELVAAGIAAASDDPRRGLYYRFRNRLMFPIHNDFGDVVAFTARQLVEDKRSGKYINSPETTIFKKSKVFFGLDKARREIGKKEYGYALLCEGQMDVIACHERGFLCAIATSGTALTEEQAVLIKRYTKQVLLCYDSDAAGQDANKKAFVQLARQGLTVKVVVLPDGDDPDSFMQEHGAEAFQRAIDEAQDFFDYKIRYEAKQRDLTNASNKAEVAAEMSVLIAAMSDSFQLQAALSFVSTRLGMSEEDIRNASRRQVRQDRRVLDRQQALRERDAEEQVVLEPIVLHDALAALCHMSMNSVEAYEWMQEQIEPLFSAVEGYVGERVFRYLISTQPRPESPAKVLAYLDSMPELYKISLTPLYGHLNPNRTVAQVSDPLAEAQLVFKKLSIAALEKQRKQKTLALGDPHLSSDELRSLQEELLQITQILSEVKK